MDAHVDPPPQYVAYPREFGRPYGTVERLEALGAGYYGLNLGFLWMILCAVMLAFIIGVNPTLGPIAIVIYPVTTILATLPYNKKIAVGKGWPGWAGLVASVCIGLTSFMCGGLFGCIAMQQIAVNEMKKYGVKVGFSFTKKQFRRYVEQRRELGMHPPAGTVDLNGPR